MAEIYRGAVGVNPAGAGAEAVGAVVTPGDGETLRSTGLTLNTDLAAGAVARLGVQESTNAGVAWADLYEVAIFAAGTIEVSDIRFLVTSANRQARGSTNLQYRLVATHPGGAANRYSAALRGYTAK